MFIKEYKNIVIKIGSSTVIWLKENGLFENFIVDISSVMKFAQVTLVTSGAIATARILLNMPKPTEVSQKQALSSIGQIHLMQEYITGFAKSNIKVGQILLTKNDISNTQSLLNLHSTLNALREMNAIPILNENDAISTDEIKVGDNDTLASHIALAINADLLIILTDVNGVYDSNPSQNPNAKLITQTNGIQEQDSGEISTEFGSGGIETKVRAGNFAVENGFSAIITNGRKMNPITTIEQGNCTVFCK